MSGKKKFFIFMFFAIFVFHSCVVDEDGLDTAFEMPDDISDTRENDEYSKESDDGEVLDKTDDEDEAFLTPDEEENDPCVPNICGTVYGSTGKCAPDGDDYFCECHEGFEWDNAQKKCVMPDPCIDNPCGDGADCESEHSEESGFTGEYDCDCGEGFVYNKSLNRCGEIIFFDDFEGENSLSNWTLKGDWEIGVPDYTGPTLDINPFHEYGNIAAAYSGKNVLATKLKDSYGKSRNDDATVDMVFAFNQGDKVFFAFKAYAHTEQLSSPTGGSNNVDGASLLVGNEDEFKYVKLESPDSNLAGTYCIGNTCSFQGIRGYGEDNTYGSFFGSMTVEEDGEKTIKFKFRSDGANQDAGVYIDDFTIYKISSDDEDTNDDYEENDDEYPDE
jgi:hypothetical protein